MSPALPSRAATWLLECVLPPRNRDAVIGDLAEEYWLRLRSQPAATAAQWYWAQVLKSLPRLVGAGLASGRWYLTLGIAFAVFVGVSVVETGINYLVYSVVPLSRDAFTLVSAVIGLTSIGVGGYLAARFRPAAAILFAAAQALMVVSLMITRGDETPFWFQITFLVLAPAVSLAGGIVYLRRHARAGRPAE